MTKQTTVRRQPKPRPRSAATIEKAKRRIRSSHIANTLGIEARVAQVMEVALLYALGYRVDLDEEVEAFTDILAKGM